MAVGLRVSLQTVPAEPKKRTRDTFLYQDPRGSFQCADCRMWLGPTKNRCAILGPKFKVDDDDSCNLYCQGKPNPDQEIRACITPEEAGFVDRPVRCENCSSFNSKSSTCKLFKELNDSLPELFDLDESVDPKGCCTANRPR